LIDIILILKKRILITHYLYIKRSMIEECIYDIIDPKIS